MLNRKILILLPIAIIALFGASAIAQPLGFSQLGFFGDRHIHFEFGNSNQFAVRTPSGVVAVNIVSVAAPPRVVPVLTPSGEPITDVVEVETHISIPTMYFISTTDHVYAADSTDFTATELRAREIVTPDGSPIAGALQVEHRGGGRGVLFIRTATKVYATDFFTRTDTQFSSREVVKPDGSPISGSIAMAVNTAVGGFVVGIVSANDGVFGSDPLNTTEREVFTREIVKPSGDSIRGAGLLTTTVDTAGFVVAVAANDEGVFGSDPLNSTPTQLFTREIVKPDGSPIGRAQLIIAGGFGALRVAAIANREGVFGTDPLNSTPTQLFTREIVQPDGSPIQGADNLLLVPAFQANLNVVVASNPAGVFGSDPLNSTQTQLFTREIVKPSGDSIAETNLLGAMLSGPGLVIAVAVTPGGVFGSDPLNSTQTQLFTREIVTPAGESIYGGQGLGLALDGSGIVVAVVATPHTVYGSNPLNFTQTELFTREIVKSDGLPIRGVTHVGFLPTPVVGAVVGTVRSPEGVFMTQPANFTETQLFTQEITISDNPIAGFPPGAIATPAPESVISSGSPFALVWGSVPGTNPNAVDFSLGGLINGSDIGQVDLGAVDEFRVGSPLASVLPSGLYELQVVAEDFRGFTVAPAPINFTIGSSGLSPRSPSAPEPTSPAQGAEFASEDTISLGWISVPGAAEYRITAARNGTSIARSISLGPLTELNLPASALGAGFYEFQITAATADGFLLASEIRAFRVR